MTVDLETLVALIADEDPPQEKYPVPEQKGPLRRYDREMRCASRRCGSPTYFKYKGVQLCMIHCLNKMNEDLYEYEQASR